MCSSKGSVKDEKDLHHQRGAADKFCVGRREEGQRLELAQAQQRQQHADDQADQHREERQNQRRARAAHKHRPVLGQETEVEIHDAHPFVRFFLHTNDADQQLSTDPRRIFFGLFSQRVVFYSLSWSMACAQAS